MNSSDKLTVYKPKSRLQLVAGLYNPFVMIGVVVLYATVYYFPVHFVPDYWHISEIENIRAFIWNLLSVTLGFSGLILTLLLLTYNFFVKSTKRNTLEFIFENPSLRILFSGFVSILLVQVAAYCMLNKDNAHDKYAVIYFLLILTVGYILSQLPLAILGLKYSTSIEKINKIFEDVEFSDVDYLVNSADFLEKNSIEKIEGNRIVLLKDIGLSAIKDSDWILPQKILSNMLDLIHRSKNEECPIATTEQALYLYLWLSAHFQRTAVKNSDQITVNVLNGQALNLYYFFAEHKVHDQYLISQLDDYVKELILTIITSRDFSSIRNYWLRDYTEAMAICISSLSYTDEQLPTKHYIFNQRKALRFSSYPSYQFFWNHLIRTQITNLVEIIEFAIEQKDKYFYDTYQWQIRHLMDKVASLKELTESQKREYLGELLYATHRLDRLALDCQLSHEPSIVTHIEIEKWARNGWTELYRPAMYHQSSLVKSLVKGEDYNSLLDELFLLGRSICNLNNEIAEEIKDEVLDYLLDVGLKLYENRRDSAKLKYDLQYQLHWLFNSFVKQSENRKAIAEKFAERVTAATEGFDYYKRPDF